MDEEFPSESPFNRNKFIKTYSKRNTTSEVKGFVRKVKNKSVFNEPLTTKNALKYLLEGTLKKTVCRYCLNVTSSLSELDQILQIANKGAIYKVTIRNVIASFHPFQVTEDPNIPNKICEKCLDRAIGSYLFTQQCERAERALKNCLNDMYDKIEKLDPLERPKKRGRQKLHPNYNILYTEHKNVIDYAEPIVNLVHTASEVYNTNEGSIKEFECLKCCEILPSIELLLDHEKSHPSTMWYNCRLCGSSFPKRYQLKRHINAHSRNKPVERKDLFFNCTKCSVVSKGLNEYLQHIEKHKFKTVMEHLVERKLDRLCTICFDKSQKMSNLDKTVCLHGGFPELSGERNLTNILGSTLPDMNILHNYTGSKICEKCLNNSITSYIFIQQFHCSRNRLNRCIDLILDGLKSIVSPENNVFIEISDKIIMPAPVEVGEKFNDERLKVDVLEDEFRVKSEDSDSQSSNVLESNSSDSDTGINPAIGVRNTYSKNNLVNGYQSANPFEKVSEFLSFKGKIVKNKPLKSKFKCPLCSKNFITESFLRNHIPKHINKKVECKICLSNFNSKFMLHEHIKMAHILQNNYYSSCTTCGRCFGDKRKLAVHKRSHLAKKCDLCEKVFKNQEKFNSHMQRHCAKLKMLRDRSIRTCSFCEKAFYGENETSKHVNKVHLQIKPYNCDMCDCNFYTEFDLNEHKKVHSLFSKETCEFCNKILKSRKKLVLHLWQHLGITPYICQVCGTSFNRKYKLKKHMRVFHGGQFVCRFCKIAFISKMRLKEHFATTHAAI